jgi:ParB-like chromosome segregation protein Spo0J
MGTSIVNISTLRNWDKNPRDIKPEDFERLKRHIQSKGLFKPFIITKDGTVLGGNMRLKACQELGIEDVPVSVVDAKTDKDKLEYALMDNDRAGYYLEDKLMELAVDSGIELDDFSVDLGKLTRLSDLIEQFSPCDNDSRLDELKDKDKTKCPECGYEFTP